MVAIPAWNRDRTVSVFAIHTKLSLPCRTVLGRHAALKRKDRKAKSPASRIIP